MYLYLVRHGDAVTSDIEPNRPLSEKGKIDIKKMVDFLKKANVSVETIYHSGKLRAEQTAVILSQAMKSTVNVAMMEGLLPDDPIRPFVLRTSHWQSDTMIVGHLPFLALLLSELLLEREDYLLAEFETGSVICLETKNNVSWQLQWMIVPHLLENS